MGGVFALVAMVRWSLPTDAGFTSGDKYRVTAVNAQGEGPDCHDVTPAAGGRTTACELPGVPVISDLNPDGSDNDMAPNQPVDGSVKYSPALRGRAIRGRRREQTRLHVTGCAFHHRRGSAQQSVVYYLESA